MRITANIDLKSDFRIDLGEEVLRVDFDFNHIDVIDKSSLTYFKLKQDGLAVVPTSLEKQILNRIGKLFQSLVVDADAGVKVYRHIRERRFFLIQSKNKMIEVDREVFGLRDMTDHLFVGVNYNLKTPIETTQLIEVDQYKDIVEKISLLVRPFENVTIR